MGFSGREKLIVGAGKRVVEGSDNLGVQMSQPITRVLRRDKGRNAFYCPLLIRPTLVERFELIGGLGHAPPLDQSWTENYIFLKMDIS